MFIDGDVNKEKLYFTSNPQVSYHYEIEMFRDENSIDLYLQKILGQSILIKPKKEIITDLVLENLDDYRCQDLFLKKIISDYEVDTMEILENDCTFESVMMELSEI